MSKMKDKEKTKEKLIKELAKLRRRIAELEKSEPKRKQPEPRQVNGTHPDFPPHHQDQEECDSEDLSS